MGIKCMHTFKLITSTCSTSQEAPCRLTIPHLVGVVVVWADDSGVEMYETRCCVSGFDGTGWIEDMIGWRARGDMTARLKGSAGPCMPTPHGQ